ncbi:hypothetical protein [Desulfoluna sp.]|uniref:hypothetical protein n=1 Tax=Desulfoluna sp. TaxID=2045199 RepID=UPI00262618F5|nr:hypothetical protein [Desulfoluna sp.]
MKITWSLPGHSSSGKIDEKVLATPLPANRVYEESGLCYAHYVRAVETVLKQEETRRDGLMEALFPGTAPEVHGVHVEILKHGPFYHPARMTLETDAGAFSLVINLAVTSEGGACAEREFALLGQLAERSEALPRVYLLKAVDVDGHRVVLFFGEWFDGFHEFHQTRRPEGDRVVVWAGESHGLVTRETECSIYCQSADILTRLYNPLSFALVQPWHHAAGDFVVNMEATLPRVRLITLRQYIPMAEVDDIGAEEILEGALFFLMMLSIRNRLDRYDGIGEVAWVGTHSVKSTLDGFFTGAAYHQNIGPLEGAFGPWVKDYLVTYTEEEFRETADAVVSSFNPQASEMGVIREHIADHVAEFYRIIQALNIHQE